jgi:hypothetical protein
MLHNLNLNQAKQEYLFLFINLKKEEIITYQILQEDYNHLLVHLFNHSALILCINIFILH